MMNKQVQLQNAYLQARDQNPKLRFLDIAQQIGVTELELLAAECDGYKVNYLGNDCKAVYRRLPDLAYVMSLVRNQWCVHERKGQYEPFSLNDSAHVGLVLGPDIDLRMFFSQWGTAWAVQHTRTDGSVLKSIQFFNTSGQAIQKVYCTSSSNIKCFNEIISTFKQDTLDLPALLNHRFTQTDKRIAPSNLREQWLAMKDTHDFHGLLKQWDVPRTVALASAGSDLAQKVDNSTVKNMLEQAAQQALNIMCFVSNLNIIQIHTGPVCKIVNMGPWLNVLDEKFNLHLNTTGIAQSWIVNKPTTDGWVTSLELFADNGEMITQFFGARKPGQAEDYHWRSLLEQLCEKPLAGSLL